MNRLWHKRLGVVVSIALAIAPLVFGLLRIRATGSDDRPMWMAAASLLGLLGGTVAVRVRRRWLSSILGSTALVLACSVASAGATGLVLGATASAGVWAVALFFGLCSAGSHALRMRSRPHTTVSLPATRDGRKNDFARVVPRSLGVLGVLPIVMSLAALLTLVITIARVGIIRTPDEGTPAHIWQLLMLAQIPIIAVFTIIALPKSPRKALGMIALQAVAAAVAVVPVVALGL